MRSLIVHLRLPFQIILAPLFLWGYVLAGGSVDGRFWVGFVAFHVFAYGGITAFNSYYDRDEGPIGALAHPPPVIPALLPFSLAVMAGGSVLAGWVGLSFLTDYVALCLLGMAYSYPGIRLKAHPVSSVLTVAIGQGIGGFLGGWLAAASPFLAPTALIPILGALAAVLLTCGFFPMTQVFQIDEDRRRGDQTFAVRWGPDVSLAFAQGAWSLGGLLLIAVLLLTARLTEAMAVVALIAVIVAVIGRWRSRYRPNDIMGNFHRVMLLSYIGSGGFLLYLTARLLRVI